ncbi:MAG: hypothetical protein LQ351_001674 [Letrouitia transgressa]|nr:MAG: hypothetical protein LQ351_001674 [Letrouitia transgressa]
MLDMMRVPVEQGAFDPAETTQPELNYETAISLFYLEAGETAIQPLEYLLHQIDLSQVEDLEWSSWLLIPDFTVMDQGLVMSHLTRLGTSVFFSAKDPFFVLSEIFTLAVNSEHQHLNVVERKINSEIAKVMRANKRKDAEEMKERHSTLSELVHHKAFLDEHIQRLKENIPSILDQNDYRWPKASPSKA